MKAEGVSLVLTTAPSITVARRIVRAVLAKRLAACIHLSACGESHYWWNGRIEKAEEIAMTFKTSRPRVEALFTAIRAAHPYKIPELLELRADGGSAAYLRWIGRETRLRR
ncbi:MAG: divalent-cation tolerance protein CutA [Verrucomicrobiae bacterium]|nr:divalent-cation tolerance protein CutA [Verrucomicrobiae bacterium]